MGRPSPVSPQLVGLEVGDAAAPWVAGGFAVRDDRCVIGSVTLALVGTGPGRGIRSWSLTGLPAGVDTVDGVPTVAAGPSDAGAEGPSGPAHPNGAVLIDHVVMLTPDPERTIAALAAVGVEHRRTRFPDGYPEPMRQDFFRLGEVILELIGPRAPGPDAAGRPARLYGLAHTVADLDATAVRLGDRLTTPKDAVQPGRRIATLHTRELDLSVPTAFLSSGPGALG
ncbi:MAG: VOC family protein [Acidimicrobiales bacterium]|nr:VOC family protein [Acidimicrobiales bacterium]